MKNLTKKIVAVLLTAVGLSAFGAISFNELKLVASDVISPDEMPILHFVKTASNTEDKTLTVDTDYDVVTNLSGYVGTVRVTGKGENADKILEATYNLLVPVAVWDFKADNPLRATVGVDAFVATNHHEDILQSDGTYDPKVYADEFYRIAGLGTCHNVDYGDRNGLLIPHWEFLNLPVPRNTISNNNYRLVMRFLRPPFDTEFASKYSGSGRPKGWSTLFVWCSEKQQDSESYIRPASEGPASKNTVGGAYTKSLFGESTGKYFEPKVEDDKWYSLYIEQTPEFSAQYGRLDETGNQYVCQKFTTGKTLNDYSAQMFGGYADNQGNHDWVMRFSSDDANEDGPLCVDQIAIYGLYGQSVPANAQWTAPASGTGNFNDAPNDYQGEIIINATDKLDLTDNLATRKLLRVRVNGGTDTTIHNLNADFACMIDREVVTLEKDTALTIDGGSFNCSPVVNSFSEELLGVGYFDVCNNAALTFTGEVDLKGRTGIRFPEVNSGAGKVVFADAVVTNIAAITEGKSGITQTLVVSNSIVAFTDESVTNGVAGKLNIEIRLGEKNDEMYLAAPDKAALSFKGALKVNAGSKLTVNVKDLSGAYLTPGRHKILDAGEIIGFENLDCKMVGTVWSKNNRIANNGYEFVFSKDATGITLLVKGNVYTWVGTDNGNGEWRDRECWDREGVGLGDSYPHKQDGADGFDYAVFTGGVYVVTIDDINNYSFPVADYIDSPDVDVTFVILKSDKTQRFIYTSDKKLVRQLGRMTIDCADGVDDGMGFVLGWADVDPDICGEYIVKNTHLNKNAVNSCLPTSHGYAYGADGASITITNSYFSRGGANDICFTNTNKDWAVGLYIYDSGIYMPATGLNTFGENATIELERSFVTLGVDARSCNGSLLVDDTVFGCSLTNNIGIAPCDTLTITNMTIKGAATKFNVTGGNLSAGTGEMTFVIPAAGYTNALGKIRSQWPRTGSSVLYDEDVSYSGTAPVAVDGNLDLGNAKVTIDASKIDLRKSARYSLVAVTGTINAPTTLNIIGGTLPVGSVAKLVTTADGKGLDFVVKTQEQIDLEAAFDSATTGTLVEPIYDESGEVIGHRVTLAKDYTDGTLVVPADVGPVTLDLNGWTISGVDGTDGASASDGGGKGTQAMTVVAGDTTTPKAVGGATQITVTSHTAVPVDENGFDYSTNGVTYLPGDYLVVDLTTGEETEYRHVLDPSVFTNDEYKTTKMVFRYVPEGKFHAKTTKDTANWAGGYATNDMELSAYWIALYEVTWSQYACVTNNGIPVDGESMIFFGPTTHTGKLNPPTVGEPYPGTWMVVRGKPWYGAEHGGVPGEDAFVGKLNALVKGSYDAGYFDFETSFQWERATRAGTLTDYFCSSKPYGETTWDDLTDYAWFKDNSGGSSVAPKSAGVKQIVGTKKPNAWGLYDMIGSASEFCRDAKISNLTGNEDDTKDWSGDYSTELSINRVCRGGHYDCDNVAQFTSVNREANNQRTGDYRDLGYRMVRIAEQPKVRMGTNGVIRAGKGGNGNPPAAAMPAVVDANGEWVKVNDPYKLVESVGGAYLADPTERLREAFDVEATGTVVEPIYTNGVLVGHTIVLGTNYLVEAAIVLPDNIGPITIDLNGWSIRGTNGVDGTSSATGTAGGSAFLITHEAAVQYGLGVTKVTVRETAAPDKDTELAFEPGEYWTMDLTNGRIIRKEWVATLEEFKRKYNTDDNNKTRYMVFRRVPSGSFEMQAGAANHGLVTIGKDYYIAVFEMTQKQYETLVGEAIPTPQVSRGDIKPIGNIAWADLNRMNEALEWKREHVEGDVLWTPDDSYNLALPTEAQWERAARGGSTNAAFADEAALATYANFGTNDVIDVGSKEPNAWGLFDVYGNIREYCRDAWCSTENLPFGVDPVVSIAGATTWVSRGGSYTTPAAECTSVCRSEYGQPQPAYGVRLILSSALDPQRPEAGDEEEPGIYGGDGGDGAESRADGGAAVTVEDGVAEGAGFAADDPLVKDGVKGYVLIDPPAQLITNAVYTGAEQIAVAAGAGYTLTDGAATNVGAYVAVAKADATNKWYVAGEVSTTNRYYRWAITNRMATVTATNSWKVYGAADPTLTAVEEGVVGGDRLEYRVKIGSVGSTGSAGSAGSSGAEGTERPAGTYDLYFEVGGKEIRETTVVTQGNYVVTYKPLEDGFTVMSAEVNPTALETMLGSFTNSDYIYDGEYHGVAVTQPGEPPMWPTGITGVSYEPTNEFVTAGVYTVRAKIATDPNYVAIDPTNVTVTINRFTPVADDVTCEAAPETSVFNGKTQTPTIKVTDVKNGNRVLVKGVDYTVSVSQEPVRNAGAYTYTFTGMGNYSGLLGEKTFTITPKGVTVKPDAYQSKVYGEVDPEFEWREVVNGGSAAGVTGKLSRATGEKVGKYDFTTDGLAVKGEEGNYQIVIAGDAANKEFEITQRPLTAEMIKIIAATNTYNGAVNAPAVTNVAWMGASGTGTALDSTRDIESQTWMSERGTDGGTGAGDGTDGGTGGDVVLKDVGDYWYVVTAAEGGNFTGVASNKYVIAPIELTIKAADTNVCYGAAEQLASTTIVYTVTSKDADGNEIPLPTGHSVTGALSRAGIDEGLHGVGEYAIEPGTLGVSDDAGNDVTESGYAFKWELGKFEVTKKPLAAGMFTLVPTNRVEYNGFWQGPTGVTAVDPEGPIAASDYVYMMTNFLAIGNYEVTVRATDGGNYAGEVELDYHVTATTYDPTKAKVTVTNDASYFVYDASAKTPGVKIAVVRNGETTFLVEGEDEDYTINYGTDNVNVGEKRADVTFTGKNYSGTTNFTYTITARPLFVTPTNDLAITYGDALPTATRGEGGSVKITGFCGEATRAGIVDETELAYDFGGFDGRKVCETNFVAKGLKLATGGVADNYKLEYAKATLTVTARSIAEATVICTPSERVYGDNAVPQNELTVSDVVDGDDLITAADWTVKGWEPAEIRTAGVYSVTIKATAGGNYTGEKLVENCYTVTPRVVEIVWGDTSFWYTGAPQKPTATVVNLVDGDAVTVEVTVEPGPTELTGGKAVSIGNYTATVTGLTGDDAANYTIEGASNLATPFDITKSERQEKLEGIFGENGTVTPVADNDGNVTNWVVKLNVDTNVTDDAYVIKIPDNLGEFTMDLNGNSATGKPGDPEPNPRRNPGKDGQSVFQFVPGTEPGYGPTQVAVKDNSTDGDGKVKAGDGSNGNPAGEGGKAFAYAVGANLAAGWTEDVETRVSDGKDGVTMQPEKIRIVGCRSRYPWQAAVDVTYAVWDLNVGSYEYEVCGVISNATGTAGKDADADVGITTPVAGGTNYVTVSYTGLEVPFGDGGTLKVSAELAARSSMLLTSQGAPKRMVRRLFSVTPAAESVAKSDVAEVEVDCRAVKPLKLSESVMFNISSNEWDTATDDRAAHVTYTRNGDGDYTLDPVEDRVMKKWSPAKDGTYEFTLTPGSDTATFVVTFPENVTNSFPLEQFDVRWNGEKGNWDVTLTNNLTGPLEIADNIGPVTLDLAGHTVTGTNGVTGAGGNAIEFTAMKEDGGLDQPTKLTINDSNYQAHAGKPGVKGGDGADGVTPGAGGAGITTNGAVRAGIEVYVGYNAVVHGGKGGDGTEGAAGAEGGKGITVKHIESGSGSSVKDGANGRDGVPHWAWCDVPAGTAQPVPGDGVTLMSNDKLYFWKTNGQGAAEFDFGLLATRGWVPKDGVIHFVDGEIKVAELKVPATALTNGVDNTLTFAGCGWTASGLIGETMLKPTAAASVFNVTADGGDTVRFGGIKFIGAELGKNLGPHDGGAIKIEGGALEILDCVFDGCHTAFNGQLGGAVAAFDLAGNSLVSNAVFTGCYAGEGNGDGGAVYATAAAADTTLTIVGTRFVGNYAKWGGAVSTMLNHESAGMPIGLVLKDDTFEGNTAAYEGGAILGAGDITVVDGEDFDDATLFEGNFAGRFGGAIDMNMPEDVKVKPVTVKIGTNTVFASNIVSNDDWDVAYGGAIAMQLPVDGCTLDIDRAWFVDNRAINGGDGGYEAAGGAIYSAGHDEYFNVFETTNLITKTAFLGNGTEAKGGNEWATAYGGAYVTRGGLTVVDNCVFGSNTVTSAANLALGGSLDFEGGDAEIAVTILNSTFRDSNVEAIGGFMATVGVTNCVVVGNGETATGRADIDLADCAATMAYSAYGAVAGIAGMDAGAQNLGGRDADDVYAAADTLKLRATGFNPVAALGLVQPGVTDFEEVEYGSKAAGWSMGAFETPTEQLTVIVDGDRRYDGSNSATGIAEFVWAVVNTNGDEVTVEDIGDITNLFEVASWAFESKDVGEYCGTNETAEAESEGTITFTLGVKEGPYDFYAKVFKQVATGEIAKRPVQFKSGSATKAYDATPLVTHEAWDCSAETLAGDEPCGLVPGEEVGFVVTGSRTEVGESENTFGVDWTVGTASEANYDVRANRYGTLKVTPRAAGDLVVEPTDFEFVYGGTNICPGVTVTFTNGYGQVTNFTAGADFTVAYTNNVNAFDEPYYVVTPSSNFVGTVTNGFKILRRKVTFTSESATKVFDGTPLVTNEVKWTKQDEEVLGTGILTNEAKFLRFNVTGSQTKKGESDNTFEVIWKPGICSSNYVAKLVYGTLTVTVREGGEFEIIVEPDEYAWTGDYVKPTKVEVWDRSIDLLVPETEYVVYYENNLQVTDSAKVTVRMKPESSWVGQALTNYWITAYTVEYYKDGEQVGPTEKFGAVSGSNAVAAVTLPDGYCIDIQHSRTNGVVTRFNSNAAEGDGLLHLVVRYELDKNGDDVPDKYQKVVCFKVVNGYWNDASLYGYDIVRYVTLFAADNMTWDENGTATLETAPEVGERPLMGYAKNVGKWCPELPTEFSMSTPPFFLYAYGQMSGEGAGGGRIGRGNSGVTTSNSSDMHAVLKITSFTRSINEVTLGTHEAVVDRTTGATLLDEPLYGTRVVIEAADSLGGEWKTVESVVTDREGRATTKPGAGTARFFRARIVE